MESALQLPRKRVFITGVTGQDGYYLARMLVGLGWTVYAGARAEDDEDVAAIRSAIPEIHWTQLDLLDGASIAAAIESARPDQVYHLAGISHIAAAWRDPDLTLRVNTLGTLHLLQAVRARAPSAHLVFAGSGDSFDHAAAAEHGLSLETPLRSTNPYSVSKTAAMQLVQCYRAEHGLRGSVAVLLNHTSPRRPPHFVERKIVREAVGVALGWRDKVVLGSLETRRDWSWAEDIVEAMFLIANREEADDFVLGSGEIHTTGEWVRRTFGRLGLTIEKHLEIDTSQLHRGDRPHTFADIRRAKEKLGWSPRVSFESMVERLIEFEMSEGKLRQTAD